MKMVKSLLLGSAAGLVAVTAGQAADLPVKAQPVQYVKVCSLYGAGFYYMPGTDTCIKIGGWTRAEAVYGNDNGSSTWGPFAGQENTRTTSNVALKFRGYITADAREQTAYGVARGFIAVGLSNDDAGTTASEIVTAGTYANRAYVQWAGFTAGKAQSFYDFYSVPATGYRAWGVASDTGDGGWWVWGYTSNFGGGFSATVSAEGRRMTQIIGQGTAPSAIGNGGAFGADTAGSGYGGFQSPDLVANLRLDQAWGSAQIMGAAHEVNATYYSAGAVTAGGVGGMLNGHPSDTWGWAVGAGLKVNFPSIAPGDYLQTQVNYTQGAVRYLDHGTGGANMEAQQGGTQGFGLVTDCVFGGSIAAGNNTGCNLTTAWSVNVGYEHYWTPNFRQSLTGGYFAPSFNTQANAILCSLEGAGSGGGTGTAAVATTGCNNNWSVWEAGSRMQYDVTKSMYVGVEVLYSQLTSGTQPGGTLGTNLNLGAPSPATGISVAN